MSVFGTFIWDLKNNTNDAVAYKSSDGRVFCEIFFEDVSETIVSINVDQSNLDSTLISSPELKRLDNMDFVEEIKNTNLVFYVRNEYLHSPKTFKYYEKKYDGLTYYTELCIRYTNCIFEKSSYLAYSKMHHPTKYSNVIEQFI